MKVSVIVPLLAPIMNYCAPLQIKIYKEWRSKISKIGNLYMGETGKPVCIEVVAYDVTFHLEKRRIEIRLIEREIQSFS